MKPLRSLGNFSAVALPFTLFSLLLTLSLNHPLLPTLPLVGSTFLFLSLHFFLLSLTISFLTTQLLQFIAGKSFDSKPLSVELIYPSLLFHLLYLGILYPLNLWKYRAFLTPTIKNLFLGLTLLFLGLFSLLLLFNRRFIRKEGREKIRRILALFLLGLTLVPPATLPLLFSTAALSALPPSPPRSSARVSPLPEGRIINLYIDGLSLDFLFRLIPDGKLPNFSWLRENGSWGTLRSFSPPSPPAPLASYLSGLPPSQHHRFSLQTLAPGRSGSPSLYFFPDGLFFLFMERLGLFHETLAPTNLDSLFQDLEKQGLPCRGITSFRDEEAPGDYLLLRQPLPPPFENLKINGDSRSQNLRFNILLDNKRLSLFRSLLQEDRRSRLLFLYLDGLLDTEQRFYRYALPEYFSGVTEEEVHLFGDVIERYYQFLDQALGQIITSMGNQDLLVITSSLEIEPVNPVNQVMDQLFHQDEYSASFGEKTTGVIIFYGDAVKRGESPGDFAVTDAYPLFFYYLRLPLPSRVQGGINLKMFTRDFIRENPLIYSIRR